MQDRKDGKERKPVEEQEPQSGALPDRDSPQPASSTETSQQDGVYPAIVGLALGLVL